MLCPDVYGVKLRLEVESSIFICLLIGGSTKSWTNVEIFKELGFLGDRWSMGKLAFINKDSSSSGRYRATSTWNWNSCLRYSQELWITIRLNMQGNDYKV